MTEPVTAHTQRFVRCLWTLDRDLAYARHYPAVALGRLLLPGRRRARPAGTPATATRAGRGAGRGCLGLLAEADRLAALAELVGAGALPGHERMVLLAGRLLREGVLQQSALSPIDARCGPAKRRRARRRRARRGRPLPGSWSTPAVPAAAVEEVDFGPLLRAREETGPDDAEGVTPRGADDVLAGWRSCDERDLGRRHRVRRRCTRSRGPLLVVRGVSGVGWDEFAADPAGRPARPGTGWCSRSTATSPSSRCWRAPTGMRPAAAPGSAFTGEPLRVPVGDGWLGRVCNGRGEPLDGGPPVLGRQPRRGRRAAAQPDAPRAAAPSRCSPASRRSTP